VRERERGGGEWQKRRESGRKGERGERRWRERGERRWRKRGERERERDVKSWLQIAALRGSTIWWERPKTQVAIKEAVDVGSAKKIFTLRLDDLGPYTGRYSRNGRHLLLGGKLGHLALCDWQSGNVTCEIQVRCGPVGRVAEFFAAILPCTCWEILDEQVKETVRDVCFLHNETMFAAAQRKYVYVYDNSGVEVSTREEDEEWNRVNCAHETPLECGRRLILLISSSFRRCIACVTTSRSTGSLTCRITFSSSVSATQGTWSTRWDLTAILRRNFPFLNRNEVFRRDGKNECGAQQRSGK
jgi:hypothetical protein